MTLMKLLGIMIDIVLFSTIGQIFIIFVRMMMGLVRTRGFKIAIVLFRTIGKIFILILLMIPVVRIVDV
jgi:hypothetical protein